ncbi:Dullard-like phosphatase domain protein [Ostertagia ostertagi]
MGEEGAAPPAAPPAQTQVVIDRHPVRFSVHARPHVDYFLSVVSQWFDLVVFTASMEVYGTHVADKLDNGRGILNRRYFRQHCTMDYGGYTKDLSAIHQDLSSIFILDNSPGAYRKFPLETSRVSIKYGDAATVTLSSHLHSSMRKSDQHQQNSRYFFRNDVAAFVVVLREDRARSTELQGFVRFRYATP